MHEALSRISAFAPAHSDAGMSPSTAAPINEHWRRLALNSSTSNSSTSNSSNSNSSNLNSSKITVSHPSDGSEREADRMADEVMRTPSSPLEVGLPVASTSVDGERLDSDARDFFEPRFGRDLSQVRLHANDHSTHVNRSLHSAAFTIGQDIYFGASRDAASTSLLAHELAHTVQHARGDAGTGDTVHLKEDWNFTPTDYAALQKKKGKLTFAADSSWFSQPFRDNLLATLKFSLTRTPAVTTGISVVDFYHGHVVVKGKAPQRLKDLSDEYVYQREEAQEKRLGGKSVNVTSKNLPQFAKAMNASLPSATALLEDAAKNKDVAVIYHTFEHVNPHKLKAGSPQRNIITPMGGSPASYSPPDVDNASSVYRDYTQLFQFAFLVDENGVIHVRPGSHAELSTVTGKPESDRGTR